MSNSTSHRRAACPPSDPNRAAADRRRIPTPAMHACVIHFTISLPIPTNEQMVRWIVALQSTDPDVNAVCALPHRRSSLRRGRMVVATAAHWAGSDAWEPEENVTSKIEFGTGPRSIAIPCN